MRPDEPLHDVHARAWSVVSGATMEERQAVLERTGLDCRDARVAVVLADHIRAIRLEAHAALVARNGDDRRA